MPFNNFNIIGSYVIPSRYITNRKEVKTTNVPASGCSKTKAIGIRMIEFANKTVLTVCCLMLTELITLESNSAVPIFANSAG